MAALTFQILVGPKTQPGSIRSWLNYALIDSEGCLLDAQAYLFGDGMLRAREMRTSATVNIAEDDSFKTLPTGFLDPLAFVYQDGCGDIELWTEDRLIRDRSYDGLGDLNAARPSAYAIYDEKLNFDTKSDDAYAATLLFYKQPTALSNAAPTNFLTTRYPNLLRTACLMKAAEFRQDDAEYARWQKSTDASIARINAGDDLSRRGTSAF